MVAGLMRRPETGQRLRSDGKPMEMTVNLLLAYIPGEELDAAGERSRSPGGAGGSEVVGGSIFEEDDRVVAELFEDAVLG
jgi:hypothetical protein